MAARARNWNDRILVIALAALAAICGLAAYRLDAAHSAALDTAFAREAATIAAGKAALIGQWREERLRDGRAALEGSRRFASLWPSIAAHNAPAPAPVRSWIESLEPHGYKVALILNASGTDGRRTDGGSVPVPQEMRAGMRSAFALRRPILTDMHPGPVDDADLDVIVPLYDPAGAPAGALALPIDPAETLYPLLHVGAPELRTGSIGLVHAAAGDRRLLTPWPMSADAADIVASAAVGGTDWAVTVRLPRPASDWMGVPADLVGAATALGVVTAFGVAAVLAANGKLRGSRIRRALLAGHEAALLFDRDEILIAANEPAEQILLRARGSLRGARMRDIVPAAADHAAALWGDSGAVFEARIDRRGGTAIDVEVRGRAMVIQGSLILRVGLRDISARKRAEQEFQAVLETTSDAFCFVNASGALRRMNDAFCALVDRPRDALADAPIAATLGHEIAARVAAVRERGSDRWETGYQTDSGAPVEVEIGALHLPGPDQVLVHLRDVTARNAAFRRLEESERSLDRVVEGVPHPIYVFDVATQSIAFSNHSLREFLGCSAEALQHPASDLVSSIIHPDDIAQRRAVSDRVLYLEDGGVEELDVRVRNAAGEWRWVHCRENVLSRTPDGRVRQILGTAEDITDRMRAAEELHEKNELLNAAFDAMPVSLVVIAPNGDVLRWNKHAERLFGWTADEVLGRYSPMVPQESLEDSRAMMTAVAAGAEIRGRELVRQRKDGTRVDVALWTAPVRDRDGKTVAIFSAFTDITVEKLYRAELEKSRASLLRAQRMASFGSWESDLRTNRAYWCDGMYQIIGVRRGEVEPSLEAYLNAIHPEDRASIEQSYQATRVAGGVFRAEHRIIRPDGAVRIVQQWAEVALDANGVATTAAGTLQDVTEQRAMQRELWQAQKLDTVGRIAGGIAHDFNNVLTVVNGYADMLARRTGDPLFVASAANEIRAAGRTASDLTTKLLAFSRKQALAPSPVDLTAVVRGMSTLLSGLVGEAVRVRIDTPEQTNAIMADSVQLEQVLMNLALNARDAMPEGGLLRISVANAGGHVRLLVSDTGMGMSDQVRAQLFEPFFTTKEPGKGTGLGLATVYGIVTQSGGTISVDSVPGHGTTFSILLPVADGSATDGNPGGYAV